MYQHVEREEQLLPATVNCKQVYKRQANIPLMYLVM